MGLVIFDVPERSEACKSIERALRDTGIDAMVNEDNGRFHVGITRHLVGSRYGSIPVKTAMAAWSDWIHFADPAAADLIINWLLNLQPTLSAEQLQNIDALKAKLQCQSPPTQ